MPDVAQLDREEPLVTEILTPPPSDKRLAFTTVSPPRWVLQQMRVSICSMFMRPSMITPDHRQPIQKPSVVYLRVIPNVIYFLELARQMESRSCAVVKGIYKLC